MDRIKVGDRVWSLEMYRATGSGWCDVIRILEGDEVDEYPIQVKSAIADNYEWLTPDGKIYTQDELPDIYHTIPNLVEHWPAEDFEDNEPILVNNGGSLWYKRHFKCYTNGMYHVYGAGLSKWTANDDTLTECYRYAKKGDM